ncbi:MAG: type II toxin-antitoxin system PemK/MazF family toxin [Candidatus Paceibacterota bacterium]
MDKEYIKDFKKWAAYAEQINKTNFEDFFHEREVWWCALGVNIGSEQDGKNDLFERPVLIIKKISNDRLWIVPLTSKISDRNRGITTKSTGTESHIVPSQIRTISSKRLLRKIGQVKEMEFWKTLMMLAFMLLQNVNLSD